MESVLNGTNYVRSLRGILIIECAIEAVRWQAFWKNCDKSDFNETLESMKSLQLLMKENKFHECRDYIEKALNQITSLCKCYDEFTTYCNNQTQHVSILR